MILSAVQPYKWTRHKYNEMAANGMFHPKSRHELINGDIIDISTETSLHSSAVNIAENTLSSIIAGDYHIRIQMPLALDLNSEPDPDIAVVSGKPGDYNDMPPEKALLVIEVSDSSSILFDRKIKNNLYACSGIPEYWIINLKDFCLEVYRKPENQSYQDMKILEYSDNISPVFNLESSISVADILPRTI